MEMAYKITEVCGDWALHIPPYGKTDAEMILIFNSRNNAELVKSVLEWEDAHPNAAVPYKSTLTPPNEPLTLEDAKKERYIWFTPLNDWAKVTPFGVLFFGSEELITWETLCEEWGYRFKAYHRPPEGEEDT